jgi:acyl-CoA synthetase (NDP forming)
MTGKPMAADSARERAASGSLDAFFRPRAIAVIGASPQKLTIGHRILENLVAYGFPGPIYPVHPKADAVAGLRAFRNLREIDGPVDLAHIIVKNTMVLEQLEECARKGVAAVIVNTSGFREVGLEGEELERRLAERARELKIRVFGPNCQGVISTDEACPLYSNFTFARVRPGVVSIVAQGGGIGEVINNELQERGVGLRMYASNGNACDVSVPEILEYFGADDGARVIVLHVESIPDPRRLIEVARAITRRKPVLALKSGTTREGAKAVASHTGGLLEEDATADLVFEAAGIVRVRSTRELCDAASALASQPVARGRRLAILTNAGSPAICATDEAVNRGLSLPEPSGAAKAVLRASLFATASLHNPVDMMATATAREYGAAIRALLGDPGYDALLVSFITPFFVDCEAVAREIVAASSGTRIPVVANVMASPERADVTRILEAAGIPTFYHPEAAAGVVAVLSRAGEMQGRVEPERVELPHIDVNRGRAAIASALARGGGWLEPPEAFSLASAYGIPVPEWGNAASPEEAAAQADRIGFPVVLKAVAQGLVHRSDEDAVVLDLRDQSNVFAAAADLLDRFSGRSPSLFVQKQAPAGTEVLVGASAVANLGHTVAFGLGGILVEVMKDIVFGLAPLSPGEAKRMIGSIRGADLIAGMRGKPGADRAALVDLLLRVSRLVTDNPAVRELDLNPVIARPAGEPTLAVDVRVRVEARQ